MASFQKSKLQDFENSNFKNYKEAVGGGASPEGSSKPGTHGHGVNSDYRKENNDTMQPRTDDGKFTYKSANGKSIDPKYGPSRGKTVNPLLTGGVNGIKIDDVEEQFANQSGKYWDKYKDKWYQEGGEMSLLSQGKHHKQKWSTRVAGDAIWNVGKRRYDTIKGEFVDESTVFAEGKKGAQTKEEKLAAQKAAATGEEQAVINQSTGGIKVKPGMEKEKPVPAPAPTPAPAPQPSPVQPEKQPEQPSAPQQEASAPAPSAPAAPAKQFASGKYSQEDADLIRKQLKAQGENDPIFDDDEALEEFIDDIGGQEFINQLKGVGSEPTPSATNEEKEETDAIKKIKGMGFDGE